MSIIQAEHISKYFTDTVALDDVSLEIPEGKIFGLLGPNGAGKTTFIRILNQILSPDSGTIRIREKSLHEDDIYRIGYLPEERGLYKKMRVGEQAVYFASLKGMHPSVAKKELKIWFERMNISDWWDKRVEELSKGMQQKIQFIITVLHEPEILILDEPFTGFDPINTEMIKQEILNLQQKGASIILSTHNMNSVEELCDSIALFNHGKKVLEGAVHDIKQSFSANQFVFSFEGYFDKLSASLSSSYKIVSHTQIGKQTDVCVELTEDVASNSILSHFAQMGTIIGYKKVLPSMHDVFLQTVSQNSSQN
ncbi:MAG: ATP-binding cassette domain-containing protein [Bacteroidales bacterium]|jgi:ABC-2 type transport system ATP-binding protein|nr:ATP-binding cassette domain-containing protein [Bacteroidales bacterium]